MISPHNIHLLKAKAAVNSDSGYDFGAARLSYAAYYEPERLTAGGPSRTRT